MKTPFVGFGSFTAFYLAVPPGGTINAEHFQDPPHGKIRAPAFFMPCVMMLSHVAKSETLYCYIKLAGYTCLTGTLKALDDKQWKKAVAAAQSGYDLTVADLKARGFDVREGALVAMPRSLRLIEASANHLGWSEPDGVYLLRDPIPAKEM